MRRTIYGIQMKALQSALEHLRIVDLDELEACARELGTPADVDLIDAVRKALPTIPTTHH